MRLAIFDLDNTLLAGDSDFLWGQFLIEQGRVDRQWYEAENRKHYEAYAAGTLDIEEYCRFAMGPLAAHDLPTLHAWREQFVREKIEPIVAPLTPGLLERHRAEGDHLLITTATNRFIVEPIAALLGVDTLIATEPEMNEGRYTGQLTGIPNFQDGKVRRLRAWLAEQGQKADYTSCYSDSRNDVPLLEMADRAVAVDPDPVLRAIAQERGWAVISLREIASA